MQINLSKRFVKDTESLSTKQKDLLYSAFKKLPTVIDDSHRHLGLGIRKIHRSGIFEARLGLGLRMIFTFDGSVLNFHRLGSHDEIRKYLKNL
jgi:mRNA-degrading endonuclease YafQ of YafQ-DinJ toxin-antitoxin module